MHFLVSTLSQTPELNTRIALLQVAIDPVSGQSRGFGYVHFEAEDGASKAIEEVNGHTIAGKQV